VLLKSIARVLVKHVGNVAGFEGKLKAHLAEAERASRGFVEWADDNLPRKQTGATSLPDVAAAVARALLDHWLKKDQAERNALIKELEKYRFRSWEEIPAGTGYAK
jgi:hypothetical protein